MIILVHRYLSDLSHLIDTNLTAMPFHFVLHLTCLKLSLKTTNFNREPVLENKIIEDLSLYQAGRI